MQTSSPAVAALLCCWVVAALSPRLRWVGPHPGAVEIQGDALTVSVDDPKRGARSWSCALRDVKRGFRTDDEVRLETRQGKTIVLYIDGATMGEEVLRAAGQDARQRVLEVPLASIASRVPGATTLGWIALLFQGIPALISVPFLLVMALSDKYWRGDGLAFGLAYFAFEALLLAACVKILRRRPAAIGADGIRFRRFFRRRFYPYRAITDVSLSEGRVTLSLQDGESVRMRTVSWWPRAGIDEAALALHGRIEAARAAASPLRDVRAKLSLLDRRGRAPAAWRAHLASLLGRSDYRTGALTAGDLTSVIEDASLSAEHRVAAAVALSASEPEEARARTRIAAAASADDDLRLALDQAAEGEIDEGRLDRLALRVRS